jgi:superfamily II DNA or RNA helicase/HKD family nuclease
MALIDNKEIIMLEELKSALNGATAIDIHVAYFYFSGFSALAKELKNVKMRISVGSFIDPACVPTIINRSKQEDSFNLALYESREIVNSREQKKEMYVKGLADFVNNTALFDPTSNKEALKIFLDKIQNSTLEIKMSKMIEHGKMYIVHKNQGDGSKGIAFLGSSNFTYSGLIGQGELNKSHTDLKTYKEFCDKFESLWRDSGNIDVAMKDNSKEFFNKVKNELCFFQTPTPYEVYIRILDELFALDESKKITTPSEITHADYSDLIYQLDAIRDGLACIEQHNGVIVADVVGLGKSIIASAIANNLKMPVVIITPQHLKDQWNDYQSQFKLIGTRIYTSGSVEKALDELIYSHEPKLFIIDEAHRYRNELTNDYKALWSVCRQNPNNKIIVLTATPFNNDPKDIFALVKLFQTPGMSTIRSVDNLSLRFRDLIEKYDKLRRYMRKNPKEEEKINQEKNEISLELKRLIEPIIIRRSRLDILNRTKYREDIEKQGISFPTVNGPDILDYDLGALSQTYSNTLMMIVGEEKDKGFTGARYKPADFIKEDKHEEFLQVLKDAGLEETDLKTAQSNLANFMRRLLVTRFESSKEAFRLTLDKMIESNTKIEGWWNRFGKVPISKKGYIPNADEIMDDTNDNFDEQIDGELFEAQIAAFNPNGILTIDKSLMKNEFIAKVQTDILLLNQIKDEWFGPESATSELDPKTDGLVEHINLKIKDNPKRKIVIFSAYADTVNYLYDQLTNKGQTRIFKYTSADSSTSNKNIIKENFDAGIRIEKQKNDFDVLIATDAISEGYNLHRAGIIINYDIPYNPTRVIQRIGRINRVNKKVFDDIYIYNFFPTDIGEEQIRTKQISTLKIDIINSVLGTDVRTLTKGEELNTFKDLNNILKDQFEEEEKKQETLAWFTPHQERYDKAKDNKDFMSKIRAIKHRSSVVRTDKPEEVAVAFGKKGESTIFAVKIGDNEPLLLKLLLTILKQTKTKKASRRTINLMLFSSLFAINYLPSIRCQLLRVVGLMQFNHLDFCPGSYPKAKITVKMLKILSVNMTILTMVNSKILPS